MSKPRTNDIVAQVEALLEQEWRALKAGRLDDLENCLATKSALVEALAASPIAASARTRKLQQLAIRNQALLDGALRGIKSVSNRLAALQTVRNSLDTYDDRGRKVSIKSRHDGGFEKRA